MSSNLVSDMFLKLAVGAISEDLEGISIASEGSGTIAFVQSFLIILKDSASNFAGNVRLGAAIGVTALTGLPYRKLA